MTRRRPRAAVLLAVVSGLLLSTGCANIPSSSRPQVIAESVPAASPADDDPRYDEIVPRVGEAPEDIVRDFLRAGGSYERGHARSRAYLTGTGNEGWKDDQGAAVLEDSPYLNVSGNGATVQMTARQRGRIDPDGAYIPNVAPYPYTFRLKKVNGNWRIDNPPNVLLLEAGTFEAAYRPYEVYFLDSTRARVVPDVRYFAASRDSLPSLLVDAIQNGPSELLTGAVVSDLEGVTLQNNVEQEADRVRVYLTGLDDEAGTLTDGGFAQLVWTLDQLGVGGVEVYSDSQLLHPKSAPQRSVQELSEWRAFSSDGLSAASPGYFVRDGAVWTTKDEPVSGPAGRSRFGAVSVGVSTDQRFLAVVRRSATGSRTLFVGAPASLRATVTGSSLTPPTWGSDSGEVWTVRNGTDVVVVTANGQTAGVVLPNTVASGQVRALQLSRDGTRVALVAGPPDRQQLWVGVVVRNRGQATIERLRRLDLGGDPVTDVSWSDSLSVVVRVRVGETDSGLYSLYAVDVTGVTARRLVDTADLPGPPMAVAAGPALPLLTVAAGALWRTPSSTDGAWTRVTEKGSNESAPAYPG